MKRKDISRNPIARLRKLNWDQEQSDDFIDVLREGVIGYCLIVCQSHRTTTVKSSCRVLKISSVLMTPLELIQCMLIVIHSAHGINEMYCPVAFSTCQSS